jgi:uncharacterized small protein (DUF1192 family)
VSGAVRLKLTKSTDSGTLEDGHHHAARSPALGRSTSSPYGAHRDLIVEDTFMAKALLGHLAGTDPRATRETWLLRQRVADLEAEVARLKAENDELVANYPDGETLTPERLVDLEPALG